MQAYDLSQRDARPDLARLFRHAVHAWSPEPSGVCSTSCHGLAATLPQLYGRVVYSNLAVRLLLYNPVTASLVHEDSLSWLHLKPTIGAAPSHQSFQKWRCHFGMIIFFILFCWDPTKKKRKAEKQINRNLTKSVNVALPQFQSKPDDSSQKPKPVSTAAAV